MAEVRTEFGKDRDQFAEMLGGISAGSLANYERGENVPDANLLAAYQDKCGISLPWLVSGRGTMFEDASKAPKPPLEVDAKTLQRLVDTIEEVKEATVRPRHAPPRSEPRPPKTMKYYPHLHVSAGGGRAALYESPGVDLDIEGFASELLNIRVECIFVHPVDGESMFPTIAPGDIAVADRSARDVDESVIYIVSLNGDLFAKRAHWAGNDHLVWLSDNPHFEPIHLRGDEINTAPVLGRVMWVFKQV
ncbi:hypothetical protein AX761_22045 [Rhizobium sp. 58]|nr:hypothetical protein AX761_22045 [Rhizobium sp. 58]